jgi:radical SAM superfamily enzyme YgiQ (UPF0313 family)
VKKTTKVLLVYPEIPPTYWSFKYALPFIDKKGAIPPLGLLTVAALLPKYCELKLVDMNINELTNEMINWADLIFVSAMIVQKDSFTGVVNRCNKLNTIIVAGGPYPTSSHEKIKGVDYFILGEAEITLPMFLQDWENGQTKHIYQSEEKADITTTPPPRFDLLNINNYATMPLQYSRGCPHDCEFCDIIEMFGHKMRTKTNQQMLNELNLLYSLGWRGSVFIVDDNFIGNKRKLKQLLPMIADWQKKRDYPFDLFTETSIDLADDENLLDLISNAGFNMVFIGIETPDKETLAKTGKKQNVKCDLLKGVVKIQNKGIEVAGGFIIGFDNDPPDIFQRQIDFIQQSGIVLAMVGLLTALPNTQLYRRLEKKGRLLKDSTGNNTHDLCFNFKPKMDLNVIIEGYKQIINHIYIPKNYFERCLKFLQNMNPHQNSVRKVRMEEVSAFFKSILKQSFSSYGHHYLCYLIEALKTEPRMFPEAVRQAIMGHHFFKITREILAVDNFKSRTEQVLDLYREKIKELGKEIEEQKADFEKSYKALLLEKKRIISDLVKRCQKIDKDFRHLAQDKLEKVECSLENYFKNFELAHQEELTI